MILKTRIIHHGLGNDEELISKAEIYKKRSIYNSLTGTTPHIFHFPGPTGHGNTVWKIINKVY